MVCEVRAMRKGLRRIVSLLVLAALVLPVAACSGTQGVPEPTGAFEPKPAIEQGEFTIALLSPRQPMPDSMYAAQRDCMAHLQELLNKRGWQIKLELHLYDVDEQTGEPTQWQEVVANAGNAPDGYVVSRDSAEKLLDGGYAQDLAKILPEAAPMLYEKCKAFLGERIAGAPVSLAGPRKSSQIALVLQKDIADKLTVPILTADDLLSFVERNTSMSVVESSFTSRSVLMDAWAGAQGYYSLESVGISDFFYASYDDPRCALVPMESIPGFDSFFKRIFKDVSDRKIFTSGDFWQRLGLDTKIVGYIGELTDPMDEEILSVLQKPGADYMAYPLTGCGTQPPPSGKSTYYSAISVSPLSKRAEVIAKFAQWAMIDSANYDLVNYGAEGVDYRLEGERVAYLNGGKDISLKEFSGEYPPTSTSYFVNKPWLVYNGSLERGTVYVPSNQESAMASADLRSLPIWDIEKLMAAGYGGGQLFEDINKGNESVLTARGDLLWPDSFQNTDGLSADDRLAALAQMAPDTRGVAAAYDTVIEDLSKGQAK
jgi:hypothetical protein